MPLKRQTKKRERQLLHTHTHTHTDKRACVCVHNCVFIEQKGNFFVGEGCQRWSGAFLARVTSIVHKSRSSVGGATTAAAATTVRKRITFRRVTSLGVGDITVRMNRCESWRLIPFNLCTPKGILRPSTLRGEEILLMI